VEQRNLSYPKLIATTHGCGWMTTMVF